MISHSRLSPGVEFREIDKSGYDSVDYSITGTTVLACGFTDHGEDYTPQWINTMSTFERLYGKPTNEIEQYLYAATQETIDRGGVCVVSKLPYDNEAKDRFVKTEFQVSNQLVADKDNPYVKDLTSVDPSITSFIEIQADDSTYQPGRLASSRIDLDTLDNYRTSSASVTRDKIIIVDITRGDYDKINIIDRINNVTSNDVECLGIMPVMVSPMNAMFYQKIISSHTEYDGDLEYTSGLSAYQPVIDAVSRNGLKFGQVDAQNFVVDLSSDFVNNECVSKMAVSDFPNLAFNLSSTLDRSYLKSIGVVVFKVVMDPSNDNKINFIPVESFVGQLDKNAKNKESGATDYIGNIINSSSRYINFFSNVAIDSRYKNASTLLVRHQRAGIMGFTEAERVKHIDYAQSIIGPLNVIFNKACDPNQLRLDVVVDAGVSNIAAFAARTQDSDRYNNPMSDFFNAESYPFIPDAAGGRVAWDFASAREYIPKWYTVVKKFDEFCKSIRRDCMFVADIFRPVVLDGNEKIVRGTNTRNTIEDTIVPRFKYISGLNSSWSAGYSDWFYVQDVSTGDFFWCPPSIKAAGVYVYTDAYFHPWDAPAGLTRGVIGSAYDVAFSPRNDEAGRIYQQAWNYAVNYPVDGIVVEGQKTFQLNKTALDRVNVRRLMIWLEKRVMAAARRFIYEGNTDFMRQRFVDTIRPIFEEAKNGSGLVDYAIRCDETLNTPDVIDNNELRCVCAVKPVKTIEWIRLDFIITNQSASVNEEVAR